MRAYFDTSAFATVIFEDAGAARLRDWVATNRVAGTLSDFGWGELHSAIGARVRDKVIAAARAESVLAAASTVLADWERVLIEGRDVSVATAMLRDFDLNLRFPDAIHLAVAQRLRIVLASTDIRQVRAARTLGVAVVNPLEPDETRA